MKPWHWKAAVGLAAYLAFIYTAQPAHDAVMAFGRHLHDVLFWQSGFFFVFPLVFILNAPTLHSKNPMHLLRLHRKSGVFKHDMKKMTVYSLVYVSIVTLFVLTASLLVGADMSASVVLGSFITSEFSALILSGFIVVCTMYIGHRYTVVVAYSVAVVLLIVRVAMFFDRFTPFDFIYVGRAPEPRLAGSYTALYAGYFGLIGLLYFLYDLRGKRDLI